MTITPKAFKKPWRMSLFMRLAMVWPLALFTGHSIQGAVFALVYDQQQIGRTDFNLAKDLIILLPQLENSSGESRQRWIKQMARYNYYFALNSEITSPTGSPNEIAGKTLAHVKSEIGTNYSLSASAAEQPSEAFRLHLRLKDGTPVTAIVTKSPSAFQWLNGLIFFLQMAAMILFTWIAVKLATLPLERLASAAESLGTSLDCKPIPEEGPSEVARAAAAFNAMQEQIKNHLAERVQILASISHDLQTPITRMRLRADLMDDTDQQNKWLADLNAMQILVEEGITYARSAQKTRETLRRLDADALLDSLMCDYMDAGQQVNINGKVGEILFTRAHALKRIIINLLDNALKFSGAAQINISHPDVGMLEISVLDRGPGIPEHELATVLQPFYRVENSRNRNTGGTGLGLAIAHQLSQALDGSLQLKNRAGGGLKAVLLFPKHLTE
ncbi:MAG TPA: HAMP domain-containing sensor histidine kinase [Cellvibrionaceae bacterium]